MDGFVIGLGFVVGGGAGPLLALALGVELFFLALSAAGSVGESGRSRAWMVECRGRPGTSGHGRGRAGRNASGRRPGSPGDTAVLAFGAIALLYLVTEELLVTVRNVSETPWHTLVLFTGFILVFVIEMLVH